MGSSDIERQFTAEGPDLGLDAKHDGELSCVDERVACVLEAREQVERFAEVPEFPLASM